MVDRKMDVEDIVEIHQLEAFYGHAVDHPDQTLLHKVFAVEAVFDGRPCGSDVYEGLPAIMAFFARGKPPHPLLHCMTNCWVDDSGEEIRVKAKWLVRNPMDGQIYLGDYDDIVVRTDEGWRIKHRLVTPRDPVSFADLDPASLASAGSGG